ALERREVGLLVVRERRDVWDGRRCCSSFLHAPPPTRALDGSLVVGLACPTPTLGERAARTPIDLPIRPQRLRTGNASLHGSAQRPSLARVGGGHGCRVTGILPPGPVTPPFALRTSSQGNLRVPHLA